MALRSRKVTVTTTPTLLTPEADGDGNWSTRDVAVQNKSGVTIYIGGQDVTTTNGFEVDAGAVSSLDQQGWTDKPYAVVATGSADVKVLESGI